MKYISQLDHIHWLYVAKTDMEEESDRIAGKTTTVKSSVCGYAAATSLKEGGRGLCI